MKQSVVCKILVIVVWIFYSIGWDSARKSRLGRRLSGRLYSVMVGKKPPAMVRYDQSHLR